MSLTKLSDSEVLSGLNKVPPFPPIAARLLVLLANESVDLGEVADLIGSDPTFSARVLQCVNSVQFGLVQPIKDVRTALTFLGLDQTRQATVMLAARSYANGPLGTTALRRCWEHTVATAILADRIAQACQLHTDLAYTAGVIHDIGRLGLLVAYPREYEAIIRDAAARCCDLLDFESEQFGVHHAEAGRILSGRWGLPGEFRVIAGRHHDRHEDNELDLLHIVHLACRLADVLGFDITRPRVPETIGDIVAQLPVGARQHLSGDPDELRAQIEERIRIYDGIDSEAEVASSPPARRVKPPEVELRRPQTPISPGLIIAVVAAVVATLALLLLRR